MNITLGGLSDYAGFTCPDSFRDKEFHSVFIYNSLITYHETALCIFKKEDFPIQAPLCLCCNYIDGVPSADGTKDIFEVFRICCDYLMHHSHIDDVCTRLSNELISGRDLSHIINTASAILRNPIILADRSFKILTHSSIDNISDTFLQDIIHEGYYPENYIKQIARHSGLFHSSAESDIAAQIKDDPYSPMRYMTMDLVVKGKFVGFATLVEENPFHNGDSAIFSYLCRILSAKLREINPYVYGNMRVSEYVLMELLENKLHNHNFQTRLLQAGLDFTISKKRILAIRLRSDASVQHRYEFIIEHLYSLLGKCPCVLYNNSIVCLIQDKDLLSYIATGPSGIGSLLDYYELACGISNVIADPMKLSMYYTQATQSITLGECISGRKSFYLYEHYCLYHVFDTISPTMPLSELCSQKYMSILEYDQQNNTSYADTLHYYLECGQDSMTTADTMHLHRNTIVYRLKRIEELFNICLSNSDEIFSVHLTIKILRYLQICENS